MGRWGGRGSWRGGCIFDISIPPQSHHWWVPKKTGGGGKEKEKEKVANLKAAT